MNIKTISTVSGVNTVDFGSSASRFYWFQNLGTTTVHVSGKADIVAGADGVAELAAGDSVCIETLSGKVYVLGAGKVQIHNTGDKFCPFKNAPAQSGGEAVDAYTKSESDAKYAQKTDIPTTLPANGGNADTVGGVGIANLRQITQTVINTLPAVPNGEGDFFVVCDLSDTSFPYWHGHLSVRYGSYTGEYVATFRTTGNDNKVYYNTYLTNHWNGWINVADGGKANSADTLTDWGTRTVTDANDAPFGFCAALNCENAPNTFWSTILTTGSSGATNYKTQIAFPWAFGAGENRIRYRCENNGEWGSWQEISTTPIKSTTFSGTTDVNSNMSFWPKSENKIPILFECENKNATIFYGKSGNFYAYVTDNLHQNVVETAVSGTVWYVEV